MKRYTVAILGVLSLFLLSACSSNGASEDTQIVSLQQIEVVEIEHGSTSLHVETADVEALEVLLLSHNKPAKAVVDQADNQVKIHLDNDITRMLNIGRMPQLKVRIPQDYAGKVQIEGSSGNVTGTGLQSQILQLKGKSGNISLAFTSIDHDVDVTVKSGNVNLKLGEETPNAEWLLQSGSGRRSVSLPLEDRSESNRKTEGRSGDGTYKVKIKTGSGNITIQ